MCYCCVSFDKACTKTWKKAKDDTDACLEELKKIDGEPINVPKCEDLVGLLARYKAKV